MTKNIILLDRAGYANFDSFMSDDDGIDVYVVLGHRGDGKTYGAIKKVIDHYYTTGTPSAYVRRAAESIKAGEVAPLFAPFVPAYIKKRSKKLHNNVVYRSKVFKPCFTDENGKNSQAGLPILYTAALSTWQTSKGPDRGQMRYIILDEYIDANGYISGEIAAWINTLSSFMRNRDGTKIILLGNPLNQYSPYHDYYGIDVDDMKQGTIADITYSTGAKLRFVWLPESPAENRPVNKILDISSKLSSVTKGAWDIKAYRHRTREMAENSDILYSVGVEFRRHRIRGDVCALPSGMVYVFFYPSDNFKNCLKIYSDRYDPDDMRYTPIIARDAVDLELSEIIREDRDFYATNGIGNIVENWLKTVNIRKMQREAF